MITILMRIFSLHVALICCTNALVSPTLNLFRFGHRLDTTSSLCRERCEEYRRECCPDPLSSRRSLSSRAIGTPINDFILFMAKENNEEGNIVQQGSNEGNDEAKMMPSFFEKSLKVIKSIRGNLFYSSDDRKIGSSGEIFVLMEVLVLLSILRGKVPLLHHLVSFLCGPILFLSGIVVSGFAIKELGLTSFTALANPIPSKQGGKMVTSGIYSYIRHPVYTGNLSCFIGLSVMTKSSMRLLLCFLYYILVEFKSRKEEENMEMEFGVDLYQDYKQRVRGKFIPSKDQFSQMKRLLTNSDTKGDGDETRTDGFLFP